MSESVKVIVRVRPLSGAERERGCRSIVAVDVSNNQINLTKPDQPDNIKSFAYDSVFPENAEQSIVYSKAAYSLVQHVLEGYNGTVFAYGQTGCGKTHSMVGQPDSEVLQGIIPRCFGHILKMISDSSEKQFLLRCSFLQIYNQEIHDLLGDPKVRLELKESPEKGVFVKDISQKEAKTHQELMQYLHLGTKNRATGETAMNKDSSRSHLLFALYLESASGEESERKYIASRLNLVDLAGSQRLSKTGAVGERLKEAQKINLSLSALGNVISALVEGRSQHIPYRDSKLTRLLQDSLGGNTKTVMLANCSPADYNFEQTLSTLRYASRAKMIKNKPVINQDPKDALLRQYALEIEKLKKQIQGGGSMVNSDIPDLHFRLKEKEVELQNQKNQKASLLRKIEELQSRHIEGKNVKVDPVLVQNIRKISLLANKTVRPKCSIQLQQPQEEEQSSKMLGLLPAAKKEEGRVLKELKGKIKQLQRQIRDVDHQNYLQKQCLLEDIRDLSKENKFLERVLGMLLQNSELEDIRAASTYNQEKDDYFVPPFYIKNKELVFPKLQKEQSMDMIRQWQDKRQVLLEGDREKEGKQSLYKNKQNIGALRMKKKKSKQFDINDVLRDARVQESTSTPSELRMNYKIKLDPIGPLGRN